MLASRLFVRALPRVAARSLAPRAFPKSFIAQSTRSPLTAFATRNFATTLSRKEFAGENDQVLAAKLAHEHELETAGQEPSAVPEDIQYFLDNSPFKIEDGAGTGIFTLTRQFGNETIKIEVNVSDINEVEDFEGLDEDGALEDEDFTSPGQGKKTINQSGEKGKFDTAPEDSIAPSDQETGFEETPQGSFPINMAITITKPGAGATLIRARVEDQALEIENVNYFSSLELIEPKTPDQIRDAQSVYEAPPFENLDQELQTMMYTYLEDRGIDAELTSSLPDYVNFKEQREYVQWLGNMKKFIEA